jgi:hypothetical protein
LKPVPATTLVLAAMNHVEALGEVSDAQAEVEV